MGFAIPHNDDGGNYNGPHRHADDNDHAGDEHQHNRDDDHHAMRAAGMACLSSGSAGRRGA